MSDSDKKVEKAVEEVKKEEGELKEAQEKAEEAKEEVTEAKEELTEAKEELAETKNFSWRTRFAYTNTVANTYTYSLPPDYNGGLTTISDLSNNKNRCLK